MEWVTKEGIDDEKWVASFEEWGVGGVFKCVFAVTNMAEVVQPRQLS